MVGDPTHTYPFASANVVPLIPRLEHKDLDSRRHGSVLDIINQQMDEQEAQGEVPC